MRDTTPLWPQTLRMMYEDSAPAEVRRVIRALLWEIHREHQLLIMTDDLCRQLQRMQLGDVPLLVQVQLQLDQEPAVILERRRRKKAAAAPSIFGTAHRGNHAN